MRTSTLCLSLVVLFLPCTRSSNEKKTVTAEGVQKFKVMPSDTQVNPGENMTLQCQVLNRRGDCVWLKDDQVIGNISGKYSFEMEPEDGDCTLQIVNATLEEDDASWRCQVTKATRKGSPLTSSAVNLVVREQPRPPSLKEVTGSLHLGDRFQTIAGDTRSFQCVSRKGNPPASLRWFLDSNDISDLANQTNYMDVKKPRTWKALSVLNYNFTEADNRKKLKCVAYHSAYEKTAQEPETEGLGHRDVAVTLDVMSRPNNIRVKPSTDSTFNASEVITLECMAQGNPAPEIRWFKQSEENSTVWNNLGQNAKLEISYASYSDKGVYRCEATNTIDNHSYLVRSKGIRIDIRGPPNLSIYPESGELQVKEGDPFEIGCTASGYPDPVISWRHRGNSSSEVNNLVQNNTLRIDSANQMHSGTYECTANNGYGDSVVRCVTVKVLGICDNTEEKNCKKTPFGRCEVKNGKGVCSCEPPLRLVKENCQLDQTVVKVTFKLKKKSRVTFSNDDDCPPEEVIKEEVEKAIQDKTIISVVNITCWQGEVTMNVVIEKNVDCNIADTVKDTLEKRLFNLGEYVLQKDEIRTTLVNHCEMGLSTLGKRLGGLKCIQRNNAYALVCDTARAIPVGNMNVSGFEVELCQDKPCTEYCSEHENKECVHQTCLCKRGFRLDNDTCVSVCTLNVCKNGGTCKPDAAVDFTCTCPPTFKGPLCEEENKEVRSATLNTVIIGVVLSALLLICLVLTGSIILRLKKKNQILTKNCKMRSNGGE